MKLVFVGNDSVASAAFRDAAAALGVDFAIARGALAREPLALEGNTAVVLDIDSPDSDLLAVLGQLRALRGAGVPAAALGSHLSRPIVKELFEAGAHDVIESPLHKRELILRLSALVHRKVRIACIGGGTGLYTLLSGLKEVPRVLLSSIVTMSDDGGSSGRLRASFGILPPGDVRRSLVGLSNAPEVMNFLMSYRFEQGDGLRGHSLGNLLLTALCELTGTMQDAVRTLGDVLNVQGLVMCVTERSTTLCAEFEDGRLVKGESEIHCCLERPSGLRIKRVWQEPDAEASLAVFTALLAADLIVIGPGDLYTSVLSGVVVGGVADAVRASAARRLYVCNLMTKPGETEGYDVADHVAPVVEALGADVLDHVLVSCTELDADAEAAYAAQAQRPVKCPPRARLHEVTRAELITRDVGHRARLVRHDSLKLRDAIVDLLQRRRPSMVASLAEADVYRSSTMER